VYSDEKRREIYSKVGKKLKGRKSLVKRCDLITFTCVCGVQKEMLPCHARVRKYCSKKCADTHGESKSIGNKLAYANGKCKPRGGTTQWLLYKDIKVQGTYELRTCYILDTWKERGKIKDWEYTNDRIPYRWLDGSEHTYLFDFKLFHTDKTTSYLEVKGFIREHDILKWQAVQQLGLKFDIWYLTDIQKYEQEV